MRERKVTDLLGLITITACHVGLIRHEPWL